MAGAGRRDVLPRHRRARSGEATSLGQLRPLRNPRTLRQLQALSSDPWTVGRPRQPGCATPTASSGVHLSHCPFTPCTPLVNGQWER
ncbi:hypothetical protein JOF29_001080 [Kribbella aluminosa]|uniref:Uncharacterized protein n=1 Tax=Kribbella aluminosa TaxID=416017 RepID=A0ABS4UEC0_9ACTN|nr:hypothetical protein [Kribbella aluminosa]